MSDTAPQAMIYTVEHNGRVFDVEGPAGATPEQLQAFVEANGSTKADAPAAAPDRTEWGFDREAAEAQNAPEGADEYVQQVNAGIADGTIATPDDLVAVANSYGFSFPDRAAVEQFFVNLKKSGGRFTGSNKPEFGVSISDVRGNGEIGESVDAFARGVAGSVGLDDEIDALRRTAFESGSYDENLARSRAIRNYDEENNFGTRLTGELLGGLAVPIGIERAGLTPAYRAVAGQAGRNALRAGATMQEARAIAARAATAQMAREGAIYGGLSATGRTDGGLADRAMSGIGGVLAGAAGGAAFGAVGQALAPRAAGAAAARRAEPLTEAQRVAAAAERQGVDVLPQDLGSETVGRATQGAAQTTGGASTVRRAADQLYNSFRERLAALTGDVGTAGDVGGAIKRASAASASREVGRAEQASAAVLEQTGSPVDLTGAGQLIQRGATRWMRESEERASALYDRVGIPAEQPAKLEATRDALRYLTTGLKSNAALSKLWAENPRLRATLEALTPIKGEATPLEPAGEMIGGELSWEDLKRFRSIVGQIVGRPGLESDGAQMDALRKLYAGLSNDMRATAEQVGPKALVQFNRANGYFSARMNRINQTISRVLGKDNDATASEAFGAVEGALRDAAGGDSSFAARVLRTLPQQDAATVRATLVSRTRGGATFDPQKLAKAWDGISERAKSVLLPKPGLRAIMDDAATRAAAQDRDPLANKGAEQVIAGLESMARTRGDSAAFRAQMAALSPEEATAARSLLIDRMGRAAPGAQNAEGDAFSIGSFLTNWSKLTDEAKLTLFGNGEMRSHMNDLALLADRVKSSERLAGHSNTGAVNSFNATTGGLAGSVVALLTGHPIVAAGLAAPIVYQRASAEMLTSKRLLNWLVKASTKPNPAASVAHVERLGAIARAEPAIANDVLALQSRLREAFSASPTRLAADERDSRGEVVNRQRRQNQPNQQGLQP